MTDLRSKTVSALKWSYLSFFTNLLFQPLLTAILSRLLSPREFGIFAFASTLAVFGAMFTELGMGPALVQRRDLTPEHIRAAFTSALVLGGVMTVLVWLAAPLAAEYAGRPEVVPVVRGLACTYILTSLTVVSSSLLRRELRFKPLMLAEVGGFLIGHGVLGLGAAALGFGPMSLVVSAAGTWAIQLAVTYAHARHPLGLTFRWAPFRDLYNFGVRVSALRVLEFFGGNLATFMIVRLFDATALGLYNRGYTIAGLPVQRLAGSLTRVLVPSFSGIQDDVPKMRRVYGSSLLALSPLLFTISAGLFVCAPEIVRVLLGERYMAAVPLVQAFALYVPFPILADLAAIVAEATARLNVKIALQVAQLAFLAAGFWLAHRLGGGIESLAWVLVLGAVLNSAAYVVVAARILPGSARDSLRAYAVGLACGGAAGAVLFAAVSALRAAGTHAFALFVAELVLGAALLGAVVLLGPPTEVRGYALKALRPIRERLSPRRAQEHP